MKLSEYSRQHENAKLNQCMPNLKAYFGVVKDILDAFVNNNRETKVDIDNHFKQVQRSLDTIQKDVTVIKADTKNATVTTSSRGPQTWAQMVANTSAYQLTPSRTITNSFSAPTPIQPTEHGFTIHTNSAELPRRLKKEGPEAMIKTVNTAIKEAAKEQPMLKNVMVKAARSLRSQDIKVFTDNNRDHEVLIKHSRIWTTRLSDKARLAMELHRVVIHKASVATFGRQFEQSSLAKVQEVLKEHNPEAFNNGETVQSVAWLTAPKGPVSSLVVGFDSATTANYLILHKALFDYTDHSVERFDQGYRILQCNKCQHYGHATRNYDADAPTCGHCAK